MSDLCRSCKAPVIWVKTSKGSDMPIDAEPNVKGNMTIETRTVEDNGHMRDVVFATVVAPLFAMGQLRYMSHFATCKQAKSWRRR